MADIGQAYVQLIPTAKGISGQISKIIDPESERAGRSGGKKFSGMFSSIATHAMGNLVSTGITKAIGGAVQLGNAVVGVGKQALASYGNYEQLVGGVNKIFGEEMASTVMANADKAFSTAGMSANKYMETVTGFSSSLIQSLNGDTVTAASVADRAIQDMSDNANTFGTNMESIQYAYQGFAKQNYTMLDNLKLGYGGTKEEMARLITEASKMTDVQKELGIAVKDGDMSFANIANAISVVQKNMGIMGTTSAEAAGTLQGSTASMKAAWQNMLTGMADENANFGQLAENFINTLVTPDGGGYFGNLIPRIATVIQGMSTALATTLPSLIGAIVPIIQQNIPVITSAIQQIITAIVQVLPQIIPVIAALIPQIISSLMSLMPTLLATGIRIILSLMEGITQAIPQLLEQLPVVIDDMINVLYEWFPDIIDAGIQLLLALVEGILNAIPQLVEALPRIISSIIDGLLAALPKLIEAGLLLFLALVENLPAIIDGIVQAVPAIIDGVKEALTSNRENIAQAGLDLLVAIVMNLPEIIETILGGVAEVIDGIIQKVIEYVPEMVDAGLDLATGLWDGIKGYAGTIIENCRGFAQDIISGIKGAFGINSPSTVMKEEVGKNIAEGIREGLDERMSSISGKFQKSGGDTVGEITKGMLSGLKGLNSKFKSVGTAIITQISNGLSAGKSKIAQISKTLLSSIGDGLNNSKGAIVNVAKSLISSLSNAIGSASGNIKAVSSKLASAISTGISTSTGSITKIWNSLKNGALQAWTAIGSVVKGSVDTLRSGLTVRWEAIKTKTQSVWETVQKNTNDRWTGIKNTISTIADGIRSMLSHTWDSIRSNVQSSFSSLSSIISSPFYAAKNAVVNAVNSIRGLFPIRLGRIFSGIQLPHFNVSGGVAPYGIGGKGSLPSFSVAWYAKGGILNDPTLIGVGESGPEAVIPLSGNSMLPFAKAIASQMGGAGTTYNIGPVTLEVSKLEDVVTLEQFVALLNQARSFA